MAKKIHARYINKPFCQEQAISIHTEDEGNPHSKDNTAISFLCLSMISRHWRQDHVIYIIEEDALSMNEKLTLWPQQHAGTKRCHVKSDAPIKGHHV